MNEKNTFEHTVFICSPYRPASDDPAVRAKELQANIQMAKRGCEIARSHGFLPLAPHLYFTQFLDDEIPEERAAGFLMGLEWMEICDELWVFGNRITEGMAREIASAVDMGIPVTIVGNGKDGMQNE